MRLCSRRISTVPSSLAPSTTMISLSMGTARTFSRRRVDGAALVIDGDDDGKEGGAAAHLAVPLGRIS
jgi:hypothetical protein